MAYRTTRELDPAKRLHREVAVMKRRDAKCRKAAEPMREIGITISQLQYDADRLGLHATARWIARAAHVMGYETAVVAAKKGSMGDKKNVAMHEKLFTKALDRLRKDIVGGRT